MNIHNEFLQFHGNFLFDMYSNIIPCHSMFNYNANKPVIKAIMDRNSVYIIHNQTEFFEILSRYVNYYYTVKSQLPNFENDTVEILLIIYMEKEKYKICLINFTAKVNKDITKYAYNIPIMIEEGGDISFRYFTDYNITSFIAEKENHYTPVFTLIPNIKPPLLLNETDVQPICFAENTSLMIGYVNSNIRYFFTELTIMDFYARKRAIILDKYSNLSNVIVNNHFPNQSKLPDNNPFSLGKHYNIYFLSPKSFVITYAKQCNNTKQLENCIRFGIMGIPLHVLSLS